MSQLFPGTPFPTIDLPRIGGGRLTNDLFDAQAMTILNVYRGLHCPRCKAQFKDFREHETEFQAAGIKIAAISTDPQDRAEQAVQDWDLGSIPVGYGMEKSQAFDLGLFVSETIRDTEPAHFAEAGLFFILPDGTLWGSSINSFPFLRPSASMVLDAVSASRDRGYPPRGTVLPQTEAS